jgi:hypothetical protein
MSARSKSLSLSPEVLADPEQQMSDLLALTRALRLANASLKQQMSELFALRRACLANASRNRPKAQWCV